MSIDSAITTEEISAEIAEIDVLLMQYEDWRALQQLEAREQHGDGVNSSSVKRLKAILIQSLSSRTLFQRRQQLFEELELRLLGRRAALSKAPVSEPQTAVAQPVRQRAGNHDDLTRIGGIDQRLERRLNVLNIWTFEQIANWTHTDVQYVAATLGLYGVIESQMWIEQAQRLTALHAPPAPPVRNESWHLAQAGTAPPPAPAPAMAHPPVVAAAAAVPPAPVQAPAPAPASTPPQPAPAEAPVAKAPIAPPVETAPPKQEPKQERAAAPLAAPVAEVVRTAPPPAPASAPTKPEAVAKETAKPEKAEAKPAVKSAPPAPPAPVQTIPAPPPVEDDSWKKLKPALPSPARLYAGPADAARKAIEAAQALAAALAVTAKPLNPAKPLAARNFAGAVQDQKNDGTTYSSLRPAKPLPASAYVPPDAPAPAAPPVSAPQVPAQPTVAAAVAAAAASATAPKAPEKAPEKPAEKQPEKSAANGQASAAPDPRAAELLTQAIPPLPLRPAMPLPPTPAAAAAAAAAKLSEPPSSAPSEELLLAVVAARSQIGTGNSAAPPPLPPPVPPASQKAPLEVKAFVEPSSRPAVVHARASESEIGTRRPQAPEAHVVIKRPDEPAALPVSRLPNGAEGHQGAKRRREAEEIDSSNYAAYHGEVEEASVQIVRRPPPGIAPQRTPAPPSQSQTQASSPSPVTSLSKAVESAAAAAAAAAAITAGQPKSVMPELGKEQVPPPVQNPAPQNSMGRFLKALTGQ